MKKLLLYLLPFLTTTAFCQFQDFENWTTYNVPVLDGYQVSNNEVIALGFQNTFRSDDAQDGDFSIRMETIAVTETDTAFGFFLSGNPDDGTAGQAIMLSDVDSIIGYYKCNIMPNDSCTLLCQITESGNLSGGGVFYFTQSQANWTRFAFALNAASCDSMTFAMATGDPINDFNGIPGTWLMADNIILKAANGSTAEIVNHSFEEWTDITWEDPENWTTSNLFAVNGADFPALRTTDSYSGQYALELTTVVSDFGDTLPGIASNGVFTDDGIAGGEAISMNPAAIELYYKYDPTNPEDFAFGNFVFKGNGEFIAEYPIPFSQSDEYQLWTSPVTAQGADSVLITFFSGDALDSKLTVDAINFLFTVGENDLIKISKVVSYPNPASDYFNVRYSIKEAAQVEILLLDINGKTIERKSLGKLVANEYNDVFNTSHLASGNYFLEFIMDGEKITHKVMIN